MDLIPDPMIEYMQAEHAKCHAALGLADVLADAVNTMGVCGHHLIDGDPPCEHWTATVLARHHYIKAREADG